MWGSANKTCLGSHYMIINKIIEAQQARKMYKFELKVQFFPLVSPLKDENIYTNVIIRLIMQYFGVFMYIYIHIYIHIITINEENL